MRAATILLQRSFYFKTPPTFFAFAITKVGQKNLETEFSDILSQKNQKQKVTSGRAWRVQELRLKSNEDLHKLWFVCVKEKNVLLADRMIERKLSNTMKEMDSRTQKLRQTMKRILGVVQERELLKRKYRQELENEYIEKKKTELEEKLKANQEEQLPEITWEMLRAKYHNLRKGIDNVRYLERIWEKNEERQARRARSNERVENFSQENWKSFWEYEMTIGERPMQEEILKAHVKNWKSLNLKQRKIVLGFLNARRSREAKSTFLEELKVLGQKIAHDQIKSRIEESSKNEN